MDIVVTGPTYVNIKSHGYFGDMFRHGYCSHTFSVHKYLEVTDIVVTGPTYVNI